jgi:hypothetical protein
VLVVVLWLAAGDSVVVVVLWLATGDSVMVEVLWLAAGDSVVVVVLWLAAGESVLVVVLWLLVAAGDCVVVVVVVWSCAIIDSDIAVAIANTINKERICNAPVIDLDEPVAHSSCSKLDGDLNKAGCRQPSPAGLIPIYPLAGFTQVLAKRGLSGNLEPFRRAIRNCT